MEEALEKVKISIRNLKDFKACFQEYKSNLPSYFSEDKTYKTWDFKVYSDILSLHQLLIFLCFLGGVDFQKIRQLS